MRKADLVLMTLSEFASSMGLTVPQILARAVEVDAAFLCDNPGPQVLSDEAERRLRALLGDSEQLESKKPEHDRRQISRRGGGEARRKRGINHAINRTVEALADEYGVDTEELRQLALSLGYQVAESTGSLSVAQVGQLLLRLNESKQLSFGDTTSATVAGVLKNAGKLRDQPQSRKTRQSPNLRRTRLAILAQQWDSTVAFLTEVCGHVRITIHDATSPRISNDDILMLRSALQASVFVADRWGMQTDVRLSKIASHCGVSLAAVRQLCEELDVTMLKRERVCRNDAVYLLVAIETTSARSPGESASEASETGAEPSDYDSRSGAQLDLRLDGLVLTGQNFSFCVLKGASFRECELTRANFTGANLAGADFSGAILRYSVFENALLDRAIFVNADVRFANFGAAALSAGQLDSALTDGAKFDDQGRP